MIPFYCGAIDDNKMGKCEKLLEKARNAPNNFRFRDLCRLAECFGWQSSRHDGSSHRIYFNPKFFDKDGATMNFQDRNGKAKPTQVRQLPDAIDKLSQ
jgi:hypothetical protein